MDDVQCSGDEITLLYCRYHEWYENIGYYCYRGGGAGVRCTVHHRLMNISSTIIGMTGMTYRVLVAWELATMMSNDDEPQSFEIECFNEQHSLTTSVNDVTLRTINLEGFQASTSYTCCVLAVYEFYEAKRICTVTNTPELLTNSANLPTTSNSNLVGGILGLIIAILAILLAVSGVALVCLIRARFLNR